MNNKKEEGSFAQFVSDISRGKTERIKVPPHARRKPSGKNKVVHVKGYERRK
jgi:hypothetical protein